MTTFRLLAISLSTLVLLGCVPQKNFHLTEKKMYLPKEWQAPGDLNMDTSSLNWVADFGDPNLSTLIDEALSKNYDLKLTALQIQSVQARSRIARASLWPSLNGTLSGERGETKLTEIHSTRTIDSKKAGIHFSASWELDLWGRLKDRAAAAKKDILATEADYQGTRLSLAGQVTKIWYQIIAEGLQLKLVHSTMESYRLATVLIRNRYDIGIASPLDLRLALSNLATTEDLLYSRKNSLSLAKRNLQRLLQDYPDGQVEVPTLLPELEIDIPVGLPSQILERRPDIRAAKKRLMATDLRISEAHKEFFPKISLTGEMGTSSNSLKDILDIDHSFWNVLAGLTQPIFQGGRLQANLDLAESSAESATVTYQQTVYQALFEVEQALSSAHYLADRNTALRRSVEQAEAAEQLAIEEYGAGLIDIITVLEAQRRLLNAKSDLIDVQYGQILNRVDLHVALGGDFERIQKI